MKCLRCGAEIPDNRHLCDNCKEIVRKEGKNNKMVFSPNNGDVKTTPLFGKIIISTGLSIIAVTAICLILYYFI